MRGGLKSELQQICDNTLKDKTKLNRNGGMPEPALYTFGNACRFTSSIPCEV